MRRPGIYLRFVLLWSSRKNQHASERCRAKRKDEVMDQRATIAELKSTVAQQQKGMEALTAQVQKVSAQIEVNKPAPQLTANNE